MHHEVKLQSEVGMNKAGSQPNHETSAIGSSHCTRVWYESLYSNVSSQEKADNSQQAVAGTLIPRRDTSEPFQLCHNATRKTNWTYVCAGKSKCVAQQMCSCIGRPKKIPTYLSKDGTNGQFRLGLYWHVLGIRRTHEKRVIFYECFHRNPPESWVLQTVMMAMAVGAMINWISK